jgi:hypothetical protein
LQSALSSCTFWVYLFQTANELRSSAQWHHYTSANDYSTDAATIGYSTAAVQPAASDADLFHA